MRSRDIRAHCGKQASRRLLVLATTLCNNSHMLVRVGAAHIRRYLQHLALGLAVGAVLALSGSGSSWGSNEDETHTAAPSSRQYTTAEFLAGGLTVQLPSRWEVVEDSRLHLSTASPNDSDYRVLWSIDAFALHAGRKVAGVPSLAAPLIGWLRNNSDLRGVEAKRSTIGSELGARVVDVTLAPRAVNDDPGCPAKACVNFLHFFGASEPYGLAGNDAVRFYFADMKYKGTRHLLIVAIEGRDRADLAARRPAAERLIHTAQLALSSG